MCNFSNIKIGSVVVRFQHIHNGMPEVKQNKNRKGVTYCRILRLTEDPGGKEVLAEGKAECSKKDQFVKRIGRTKSFDKAMGALSKTDPKLYLAILLEIKRMEEEEKKNETAKSNAAA